MGRSQADEAGMMLEIRPHICCLDTLYAQLRCHVHDRLSIKYGPSPSQLVASAACCFATRTTST